MRHVLVWNIEVWYRPGPKQPRNKPEHRVLVWQGEAHTYDATSAACVGADACKLRPQDWSPPGETRPSYCVRVWQGTPELKREYLGQWPTKPT